MHHPDLKSFLRREAGLLRRGPVACILCEDEVEVASTLRHHVDLGFSLVLALLPPWAEAEAREAAALGPAVRCVAHAGLGRAALAEAVNRLLPRMRGQWLYAGFNAEYLFFPFCESRRITGLIEFVEQERRGSLSGVTVDLYAGDLAEAPGGVSLEDAHLDRAGRYAEARAAPPPAQGSRAAAPAAPPERQLNFYGALRWRLEEHMPEDARRIDRVPLVRAARGLRMREDFTWSLPDYNSFAGPWHNSPSCAVASFRAAKALRHNPASRAAIRSFRWAGSARFDWHSRQLMELGLMEPGQWF